MVNGTAVSAGRLLSLSQVECALPPTSAGVTLIYVSNTGAGPLLTSGVAVTFIGKTIVNLLVLFVHLMSPDEIMPSVASTLGGDVITVRGVFSPGADIHFCRFQLASGPVTVPATYVNDTVIACVSPPTQAVAAIFVSVSADGGTTFRAVAPSLSFVGVLDRDTILKQHSEFS